MKDTIKRILAFIAILATGLFAGWFCRGHFAPVVMSITKTDTTIVIDTNIYINPPAINIEINITDNIIVEPADITITNDSLIVLPMQTKTYAGEYYRCQISGYQPRLDWIEVYPETKYITTERTLSYRPKRWGIGIHAGYGIGINEGQVKAFPYVGLGISYNFICF